MTKKLILFIVLIPLLFTSGFASKDDKVAKVIIVRGKVKAINKDGKSQKLKKGMWLAEGTTLESQNRSFAKLLFIDKSQMNLGPSSKMVITRFPKKDAGIISLMKGQLRSKVTKDYMGIQNKNKSKLFIKTKSAAMGVRGTDFQVNYNPINGATSLVTFEGAVAMAQINDAMEAAKINQAVLEKIVSSDQAVMVKRGQFSGANPKQLRVTTPVKINPAQLKVMERNDSGVKAAPDQSKRDNKPRKKFRNSIPPGVNAKTFANKVVAEKAISSAVGSAVVKRVLNKVERVKKEMETIAPPEGKMNRITGELAPTAGGYVDMNTALYVPPPPGSAYDPTTETYIPPPEFGGFDPASGEYVNQDFKLNHDGEFVVKEDPALANQNPDDPKRAPASADGEPLPPPPKIIRTLDGGGEFIEFEGGFDPNDPNFDPNRLANEAAEEINQTQEEILEQNNNATGRQVEFIFNAQ